jgi:hypothetical protein
MEQLPGFVDLAFPHHVCKLHKALYGLKQAPRAWFTRLSQTLLEIGFSSSKVDPSLFLYHSNASHVFLLVYMDDIIVTGNNVATIQTIITKLQADFAIKDLGSLSYFLGIQTSWDSTRLHLRQSKNIQDLLTSARMIDSKPYCTPCSIRSKMSKFDGDALFNPSEYRQIVGALQYATLTLSNIAYSVNQLCQHMHSPTSTH